MQKIAPFKIIGIAVETTNEDGKAAKVIGELWERFYSEKTPNKIPNKVGDEVYAIYTDYESDYTGKYTCIIGMKVTQLEQVPEGMIGRKFEGGKYQEFLAKGSLPEAVVKTWQKIWNKDDELDRSYTADFEVYGAASQQGDASEVPIYIAVE